MEFDMAKPKNRKAYHIAWNAWKRCCKKVDSQGGHFTGIHDRFLRDPVIVNHNSQSDGQNKSAKSGMNLRKKTIHIISLQRKRKDTRDNGILWTLIWFQSRCLDEKSSALRIRRTSWRAYPSRSIQTMAFIFKHIVVGQVWIELEVSS